MPKNPKPVNLQIVRKGKKNTNKPKPKPNKPKPQARARGKMHKGLFSTALDVGESVAGFLPGAIRGVRNMLNMKEASFSTPASFAVVTNNTTQMHSQERVTHPGLGLAGYRVRGSQPLCDLFLTVGTPSTPFQFPQPNAAVASTSLITLNPVLLGGPLSVHGYLNDRYVIRALSVKFTTYVPTSEGGATVLCVEKDIANLTASTFDTARQVLPNVVFPLRIPKAELDYVYDGPDLFYCNQTEAVGTDAELRQNIQACIEGYCIAAGSTLGFKGLFDIEYVVDFFDPVAPVALVGSTAEQRDALHYLRQKWRAPTASHKPVYGDGRAALERLLEKSQVDEAKDEDPPDLAVVDPQLRMVTKTSKKT